VKRKLYVTTWTSEEELGAAISFIKKKGYTPRTLSGAVSAIIKAVASEVGLPPEDAAAELRAIKESVTTYELKRGEMPCTPMKSDSTS
jgi:hypothetical protein